MNASQIGKKLNEILVAIKGLTSSSGAHQQQTVHAESWKNLSVANQIQLIIGFLLAFTLGVSAVSLGVSAASYWLNREALNKTQRAFLNPISESEQPTFYVTSTGIKHYMKVTENWENTGATPAPVVITYIHYEKIPTSEFDSWKFETPANFPFRKSFAGPHSRINGQFTSIPSDDLLRPSVDTFTPKSLMRNAITSSIATLPDGMCALLSMGSPCPLAANPR
jgi:hypothetical protein